mmetsp:Transcript_43831/g.81847  ORF Transcript_43831/g.81847 Transcript_43831/m.81847 type:complete len:220 (-) Transcript_43831:176-835(-)
MAFGSPCFRCLHILLLTLPALLLTGVAQVAEEACTSCRTTFRVVEGTRLAFASGVTTRAQARKHVRAQNHRRGLLLRVPGALRVPSRRGARCAARRAGAWKARRARAWSAQRVHRALKGGLLPQPLVRRRHGIPGRAVFRALRGLHRLKWNGPAGQTGPISLAAKQSVPRRSRTGQWGVVRCWKQRNWGSIVAFENFLPLVCPFFRAVFAVLATIASGA